MAGPFPAFEQGTKCLHVVPLVHSMAGSSHPKHVPRSSQSSGLALGMGPLRSEKEDGDCKKRRHAHSPDQVKRNKILPEEIRLSVC
jgi:hypothetical protein